MGRASAIVTLVVLWATGTAEATHVGPFSEYKLVGISQDGKHAYFEKEYADPMVEETWLAVYSTATTKLVTSQPVHRTCNFDPDAHGGPDPDAPPPTSCAGKKTIGKAVGDKVVAALHKKYGVPVAASAGKSGYDEAAWVANQKALVSPAGVVQKFTQSGIEVTTVTRVVGKNPDPRRSDETTATAEITVSLVWKGTAVTAKQRLRIGSSRWDDRDSEKPYERAWGPTSVSQLAIAADGSAVALLVENRPYVAKLAVTP